jgi:phytoene dehydrogenase-like protein
MAGLKTVICESRLENGGRLASEEITMPGYWHNTLAYFQDNRQISPVWKELKWDSAHHAEFVSPPVVSSLLLAEGRSVSQHQSLAETVNSVAKFSPNDAVAWSQTHDKYHRLIHDFLIPYYYQTPRRTAGISKLDLIPRKDFHRLWRMTPRQVVDELFENNAVKTLALSQMAIPRGVATDYEGGGIEV